MAGSDLLATLAIPPSPVVLHSGYRSGDKQGKAAQCLAMGAGWVYKEMGGAKATPPHPGPAGGLSG